MIQIESLVKTYGTVRALDGLSLRVEPGVVYGFLGPNGAGKTTTMRILTGLARPDSGKVTIMDQVLGTPGVDIRPKIGVMPEEPAFYGWMTAREYLRDFIAPLYGLAPKAAKKRADELLEIVDLKKAARRRIQGFSRGMRQRLGIAELLIKDSRVAFLDEPTLGLDPEATQRIMELIQELARNQRMTIVLSSHQLHQVQKVCDRVGIMIKGRMVANGPLDQLARDRFGVDREQFTLEEIYMKYFMEA